jgi:hypothetical protein
MSVMLTGSTLHHLTTAIDEEYDPIVKEVIVVFISPNAIHIIVIIFIISHRCTQL